jgi:hypothetical protein
MVSTVRWSRIGRVGNHHSLIHVQAFRTRESKSSKLGRRVLGCGGGQSRYHLLQECDKLDRPIARL